MKKIVENQGLKLLQTLFFGILLIGIISSINNSTYAVTANNIIQAHNWSAKNGSVSLENNVAPDGTSIGFIAAGDWVRFSGVDFGTGGYNTFMAYIAVDPSANGKPIQIRIDSATGTILGTLTVASTGSWSIFKEQYASISSVTGVHDLYLVFPQAPVANIDWFVFSTYNGSETQAQRDQRMQWWREARFGQFIHWGAYSHLAGVYNGQQTWGVNGEWIMNDMSIPKQDYEIAAAKPFNPTSYNAQQWVNACKAAGQKYMVITSKHHEGFAIWNNTVTGFVSLTEPSKLYDIVHFATYGQDPLASLSQECRNQGIHFCTYYSIMDWHHSSQSNYGATMASGQKDSYVSQMKEQLQQILTQYSPDVLWFDGEWPGWWTTTDGQAMYKYLRTIKPSLIINNRVGKRAATDGDFGTPEQEIPASGINGDWESCMTINDTWGYETHDTNWKSTTTLIHNLVDCASKGGNYLLNVGPKGDGTIPAPLTDRLSQMGSWLATYGESIYATKASCFPDTLSFGRATTKTGKLYLHVFNWSSVITIPRLANTINNVYLLNNPQTSLSYSIGATTMSITLPGTAPDSNDSVVAVDLVGDPAPVNTMVNDDASGITYGGGWSISGNRGLGDYYDDVHYTTTNNDYCQYTFTGTGIDYITEKNNDQGNVDVYIDGAFQTTVSCYNSGRLAQQAVYNKTGLASGSHTIKLVKTSGTYMLVDAFKVYNSVSSTPAPSPTPTPGLANLALNKTASADSQESGHAPAAGNDGNTTTRWCANDGNPNHWWKVDLGQNYDLSASEVMWEMAQPNTIYKYKVEVSTDNTNWTLKVDQTGNTISAQTMTDNFTATARYVRITVTGISNGQWASFYEFRVFGSGGGPTPTPTPTPSSGVIFYQNSNYGGTATQMIPKGNYTLSQLQAYGFVNDWASSVKIPSGWTLIMYADDNFTGTTWTLNVDMASFSSLSPNANDKVSSCKIQ